MSKRELRGATAKGGIARALMRQDVMDLDGAVKVLEYNVAGVIRDALPKLFIQ